MLEVAAISALSVAAGTAAYFSPLALRRNQERTVAQRRSTERLLALTYDDGPGRILTPRLLSLLADNDAEATFFLLGRRVPGNEAVVDRIFAEGHEIGCHGQDHVNAWKAWPWKALADIRAGYDTLKHWLPSNGLFRPPYGKLTLPTWLALRRRGARIGWWTIDSGDTWAQLPSPESVADAVARVGGGVVLMHDFDRTSQRGARAEFVLKTTQLLIETARREGLTIRRLGDLLDLRKTRSNAAGLGGAGAAQGPRGSHARGCTDAALTNSVERT